MEIREYQEYVRQGASDKYKDLKFAGLALVGEVGEVCDVIKKASIYTDEQKYVDCKAKLLDELGDVLWQWTAIVNCLNIDIDKIIEHNVAKLNQRHGGATIDKTGGKR
jgi:NTP pyrophosphatase (non-canonical NTP hydrolase)